MAWLMHGKGEWKTHVTLNVAVNQSRQQEIKILERSEKSVYLHSSFERWPNSRDPILQT